MAICRQDCILHAEDSPPNGPQPRPDQERAETYSPNEAVDVLDLSKRRVLEVSERRELIGEQNPETGRWSILKAHVEAFREYREKTERKKPKTTPFENSSPSRELVDALREQIHDLRERLDRE